MICKKKKKSDYIPPENIQSLTLAWLRRARKAQFAHYHETTRLQRANILIGVPVVCITGIVGASSIGSLGAYVPTSVTTLLIGTASLGASALASLQTFLKLSERAEQHRNAASRYGSIRRKLETIYANRSLQPISAQVLDGVEEALNTEALESPSVPKSTYEKIEKGWPLSSADNKSDNT